MRINKYVALATGLSRRRVDTLIESGHVKVNDQRAEAGQQVSDTDVITFDGDIIKVQEHITLLLNKPVDYVTSRDGQGSSTVYDLIPAHYHHLKPVGRLDKDSSGLLLLTNNGDLAHKLTHPSFQKIKVYELSLNKELSEQDKQQIQKGVELEDGPSSLKLNGKGKEWQITMHEGRNRQIRRTFEALGYRVNKLHRTHFGEYKLEDLKPGEYSIQKP